MFNPDATASLMHCAALSQLRHLLRVGARTHPEGRSTIKHVRAMAWHASA